MNNSHYSQQITWREYYKDSDLESDDSAERTFRKTPTVTGPAPVYEEFPPCMTRPPPISNRLNGYMNKADYFVLREAEPHDTLYCEYPNCGRYFVPYLVWGMRHHCRACGLSVCGDHCTRNITLSSAIIKPLRGGETELSTPVLASSLDPSLLPTAVTFKRACLGCCDRARLFTLGYNSDGVRKPTEAVVGPERQDVQNLLLALTEVRAKVQQVKTHDASHLSEEMSLYHVQVEEMKRIIRNLTAQLEIAQTEGRLSRSDAKRLKQLRRELRATSVEGQGDKKCDAAGTEKGAGTGLGLRKTQSSPSPQKSVDVLHLRHRSSGATNNGKADAYFSGSSCAEYEEYGEKAGSDTSSEGESDSPCSSCSHSMSLDGVNTARNLPSVTHISRTHLEKQQQQQQPKEAVRKIPVDPFYAGVVDRACAGLPSPDGEVKVKVDSSSARAVPASVAASVPAPAPVPVPASMSVPANATGARPAEDKLVSQSLSLVAPTPAPEHAPETKAAASSALLSRSVSTYVEFADVYAELSLGPRVVDADDAFASPADMVRASTSTSNPMETAVAGKTPASSLPRLHTGSGYSSMTPKHQGGGTPHFADIYSVAGDGDFECTDELQLQLLGTVSTLSTTSSAAAAAAATLADPTSVGCATGRGADTVARPASSPLLLRREDSAAAGQVDSPSREGGRHSLLGEESAYGSAYSSVFNLLQEREASMGSLTFSPLPTSHMYATGRRDVDTPVSTGSGFGESAYAYASSQQSESVVTVHSADDLTYSWKEPDKPLTG